MQHSMSMNKCQLYQGSCFPYFWRVLYSLFYVEYSVQMIFYFKNRPISVAHDLILLLMVILCYCTLLFNFVQT